MDRDMVNHPSHYISNNGLEVIDVIEAFTSELKGIEATDTGNVIKYICRWKNKNGVEDLKKAAWYLNHLIEHLDKQEGCFTADDVASEKTFIYAIDKFDIIEPIFATRRDAEEILNYMGDLIDEYRFVTVADLYDLIGVSGNYTDNKYGWTDISNAEIVRVRDGYMIKLPKIRKLD